MNYSIVFLIPSTSVCDIIRATLDKSGLDYPVFAASSDEAVAAGREMAGKGARIFISQGITADYLERDSGIPVIRMPFSGLDAMLAVRAALDAGGRIVHVGTRPLYHYIERSLKCMELDKSTIDFYELSLEMPIRDQVLKLIENGYDTFIGGYPVVMQARSEGRTGIEFKTDELIISNTIASAQSMLRSMDEKERQNELDKAILQTVSDGIIAVNDNREISIINAAALAVLNHSPSETYGRTLNSLMEESGLVDVNNTGRYSDKELRRMTPVYIQEVPVVVRGEEKGYVISIKKVSEIQDMEYQARTDLSRRGLVAKNHFSDIIGNSPAIRSVKKRAAKYAEYDSNIYIYGETGTGKELFAQSIHNAGNRRSGPFVAVNCATLPENLIESELFGYVKGAFTGASSRGKQGLFEIADRGTLFLDEISELPIQVQSKLLRVIQEGEFSRVGDDKIISVDVRIISSSNKDLLQLIDERKFKEDLYYRLCTLEIDIPPLRERRSDIPLISYSMLNRYNFKHNKLIRQISEEVFAEFEKMPFYGNVRELGNIIERMVILAENDILDTEVLKECDLPHYRRSSVNRVEQGRKYSGGNTVSGGKYSGSDLKSNENDMILEVLSECEGNKTETARRLGISYSTLWRKLKKLS